MQLHSNWKKMQRKRRHKSAKSRSRVTDSQEVASRVSPRFPFVADIWVIAVNRPRSRGNYTEPAWNQRAGVVEPLNYGKTNKSGFLSPFDKARVIINERHASPLLVKPAVAQSPSDTGAISRDLETNAISNRHGCQPLLSGSLAASLPSSSRLAVVPMRHPDSTPQPQGPSKSIPLARARTHAA